LRLVSKRIIGEFSFPALAKRFTELYEIMRSFFHNKPFYWCWWWCYPTPS